MDGTLRNAMEKSAKSAILHRNAVLTRPQTPPRPIAGQKRLVDSFRADPNQFRRETKKKNKKEVNCNVMKYPMQNCITDLKK